MAGSSTVGTLKAVLAADTAAFTKAMADATGDVKKLAQSLQSDLEPRQRAVNAAIKDFLGGTEIRKAQEYAAAIQQIGGVSVLTEADQRKVNAAVADALDHYKALGVTAPENLQKLYQATAQVETQTTLFGKAQHYVSEQSADLITHIAGMALGFVSAQAAMNGLERAGEAVVDFLKDSVAQALEAEQAQKKLTVALAAQGAATPGVINAFDALAQKYQQVTRYDSDLITSTETLLVQVGGVMPNQMDRALKATTNLAAGLGIDLNTAALLVAKGFEDNFQSLQRYGVQIDAAKAKAEGMDYVLDQLNARFGGQAQGDIESYAGQIQQLKNSFADLQKDVGQSLLANGGFEYAILAARAALGLLSDKIREVEAAIIALPSLSDIPGLLVNPLSGGLKLGQDYIDALQRLKAEEPFKGAGDPREFQEEQKAIDGVSASLQRKKAADTAAAEASKQHQKAIDDLKKSLDEMRQRVQVLVDDMSGATGAQKMLDFARAVAQMGGAAMLSGPAFDDLGKKVLELARQGVAVNPILYQFYATALLNESVTKDATAAVKAWSAAFADLPGHIKPVNEALHDIISPAQGFADALKTIGDRKDEVKAPPSLFDEWDKALGTIEQDFVDLSQIADGELAKIVRAIGTVVAASKQVMDGLKQINAPNATTSQKIAGGVSVVSGALQTRKALGGGIAGDTVAGAEIGSIAGPYGALVGAGLGFAYGTYGPDRSGRQAIDDFAQAYGGFDNLHELMSQKLGPDAEHFWMMLTQGVGANNPTLAKQVIDDITFRMNLFDQTQQAVGDKFSALQQAVQAYGGAVPNSLKQAIEEMTHMNGLTADQLALLQQLSGDSSMDALKQAADDLGVSFDHMGKEFQQAELNETSLKYARDLNTLAESGADMNGVLEDSKGKLSDLAAQAIQDGLQLPKTLEPYLQKLSDMGELVGPDGLPLDISKITFADIPDDALNDIKLILEQIKELLANGIPGAAAQAANAIRNIPPPPTGLTPAVTPPPEGAQSGDTYVGVGPGDQFSTGVTVPDVPEFATGSYGLRAFSPAGEYVKLHGNEEVLTAAQGAGVASMVASALASGFTATSGQPVPSVAPAAVPSDRPISVSLPIYLGGRQVDGYILETTLAKLEANDGEGAAVSPVARLQRVMSRMATR